MLPSVLSAFALLLFPHLEVFAQSPQSDLPIAVAAQGSGMFYKADVDLGRVPAGSKKELSFLLKNNTNTTFNIPNIRSNCSCADVSLEETKVAPGKSTEVAITIAAPSKAKKIEQRVGITLHSGAGSTPVLIHCRYRLSGLLAFAQDSFIANYNIKLKREPNPLRIPFLLTQPIDPENLSVKPFDGLATSSCELVEEEGKHFVVCTVPRSAIGENGVAGGIEIRDSLSGASARLPCLISAIGEYRLIPRHLSLSWDQENKCYRANALFKFEGELPLDGNKVELSARLTGMPGRVEVEARPVGTVGVVHRLALSVWPAEGKPFRENQIPEQAEWFFKIGGKSYSTKANLSFFPVTRFEEDEE